ncbi:MAG: Uncharacterised protein family (UPF0158) [Candidatus Kentron sp. G]|nr:MAG: Uncharacterised protein family (UPF0158) [Candidatus Kentron sp. G]
MLHLIPHLKMFLMNMIEKCSLEPINLEDTKEDTQKSQKFSDIEDAMLFVSSSGHGENYALLDKSTGKIYYRSDLGGLDEFEEFSEDEYDPAIHIEIPHKNDLNLGRDLVFEFVERFIPDDYERVGKMFRKRGAYARYKDLLDSKGILQKWYDFENQRGQSALLRWCEENEVDVTD